MSDRGASVAVGITSSCPATPATSMNAASLLPSMSICRPRLCLSARFTFTVTCSSAVMIFPECLLSRTKTASSHCFSSPSMPSPLRRWIAAVLLLTVRCFITMGTCRFPSSSCHHLSTRCACRFCTHGASCPATHFRPSSILVVPTRDSESSVLLFACLCSLPSSMLSNSHRYLPLLALTSGCDFCWPCLSLSLIMLVTNWLSLPLASSSACSHSCVRRVVRVGLLVAVLLPADWSLMHRLPSRSHACLVSASAGLFPSTWPSCGLRALPGLWITPLVLDATCLAVSRVSSLLQCVWALGTQLVTILVSPFGVETPDACLTTALVSPPGDLL